MENASDALIMAANVLLFVIALTVCISSFSMLRQGVDNILGQTEVVDLAKDSDIYINYIDSKNNSSIRKVGAETVVTSMVRSIKENYVVYVKLQDYGTIFQGANAVDKATALKDIKVKSLKDMSEKTIISQGDTIIKTTIGNGTNQDINAKLKNKLYDFLKDKQYYEYLGEYVNDTQVNTEEKIVYRVITYIESSIVE